MSVPPPGSTPGPMRDMRARLRPMGIGDILDETFRLYRENFMLFVATCAVLEVPVQIINFLLRLSTPVAAPLTPSPSLTPAQTSALAAGSAASSIGALIEAFAAAIITAALAVAISNRYLNRSVTVGDAYRATMNRLGPLLLAIVWAGVRLILLGIACIVLIGIPFLIYFAVAWSLLSQVVMLENVGGGSASGRSRELIRGYWWKALGLFVVVWLLVVILTSIPAVVIGAILGSGAGSLAVRLLITGIVSLIIGVLVRPIPIAATTLLFYDLKIRKEAFDLEAMVQQAGAPPPTVPYQ
jgi:hypothetical protein